MVSKNRHILFVTGTRADYGKLKPLMRAVEESNEFKCSIFVTGMHLMARYGNTAREIKKDNFSNIYPYVNQIHGETMDLILANTVSGLSRYASEIKPDMIVIHGDRLEAMAGAIVGSFRNIRVCHIEGGELSGTVDEIIRHSVSKLSHIHCVANEDAANRLYQMGETYENIYVTGSPDIDIMLSDNLPTIEETKKHYDLKDFNDYAIVLYHPVTTDTATQIRERAEALVDALLETDHNFLVIYPNNDEHGDEIFNAYKRLEGHSKFRLFPSLRFEFFLTMLKNSKFIIGNSSAGIREAPVYCVPSVNLGRRQENRFMYSSIITVNETKEDIMRGVCRVINMEDCEQCLYFGKGNSKELFMEMIKSDKIWSIPLQKHFHDLNLPPKKN